MSEKSPWGISYGPIPQSSLVDPPLTIMEERTAKNAEENINFLGIKNVKKQLKTTCQRKAFGETIGSITGPSPNQSSPSAAQRHGHG